MDLPQGNTETAYFKYLGAVFDSALISVVYSIVDMVMAERYWGPEGTAALAVVAPMWNIIYSLGLLTGIGRSVLFGIAKGRSERRTEREYFTATLMITVVLAAASRLMVLSSDTSMLHSPGAEGTLLSLAREYPYPTKLVVPLSLFNQMLVAFLRNDGNPGPVAAAILSGDIFNIIGGYSFVFVSGMGIMKAGPATAAGASITFTGMTSHLFTEKSTMGLVRPGLFWEKCCRIIVTGFSTSFIDVAMGALTILFNHQIMKYLGGNALSVYGVIVNTSIVTQCCAYSVGQVSQSISPIYFGAGKWGRVEETLKYALYSAACFSVVWTLLIFTFPNGFIRIFVASIDEICRTAPSILRSYGISFLLLPLNIFSTYYFQALMKPGVSFLVSVLRGPILSGIAICLLPIAAGSDSLRLAMVTTEAAVTVLVISPIRRYTREPPAG